MSRIIAGRAAGVPLVMPKGDTTRPTSARLRESVFQMLASWAGGEGDPSQSLKGIRFLDLYAGSGAMALEAASRGAQAVAVESDRKAADAIRKNTAKTKLDVKLEQSRVEDYVLRARGFDVVWADPPYALGNDELTRVMETLARNGGLVADGLAILERAFKDSAPVWPEIMEQTRSRRYGDTALYFAAIK
ncbi:MAG: RsmD family RNA methyltransferase [Propionibacteriaceae bacterium]|jgi:16S rRNA (guanine966-N2)-methyltransferase|nr:RsmD family RNA methyltransferase [Propionibacteriaceae bacterium]